MTVLVTGAGLIGTHTAKLMLDQGVGVVLYDPDPPLGYIESVVGADRRLFYVERGDVRDFARLMDVILRRGVTRILHTGGLVGPRVDENPFFAFQTNVVGTLNVVEATRIRSLARAVFVSSNAVYADPPGAGPLPEDAPYGLPSTFYGTYKAMSELLVLAYQRLAGVNLIACRPCAVFGRGGYVGGGVHGRALQETLLAALRAPAGTPIPIELPPAERVYVKDAGFALREAVFVEKPTTRVYNVGSGEIVTAAMVAAAINEAVPGAQVVGAAEGADAVRPLDITLARTELQYQPRWPLREAIADYVSELRQHGA